MAKKIELGEYQKKIIELKWDKVQFSQLVAEVFDNPKLDGRDMEGRVIKSYIVEKYGPDSLKTLRTKTTYKKVEKYELTEEQKKAIEDNWGPDIKPLELCLLVFNEPVSNLDSRYKSVMEYVQELDPDLDDKYIDAIGKYNVPRSIERLIPKINEYIPNEITSPEALTPEQKRNLTSLLKYMAIRRFSYVINQYTKKYQRDIFEESFIRYVYDKTDLTEEEIDLYITLCDDYVNIMTQKEILHKIYKSVEEMYDSEDSEAKKISMGLVEFMNTMSARIEGKQARIERLVNTLTGSRSKRLENRKAQHATVLQLIDTWKDSEKRKKLLEFARKQKIAEEEEIKNLENLSEFKAFIVGLSKEEALHG